MFTLNIRDIVAVGKSGMKWNIDAQKTLTEAKQKPNPAQAIRDKITELSVIPSTETADQKATREATKAALEAGLQDILASTADKIATERTEQGNETQANAVLRLLELKHPDAVKGLSYDMQEYLKHANISSLTRLLSAGNAALVALKNEFTDDGGLTRKVGLQLQEI